MTKNQREAGTTRRSLLVTYNECMIYIYFPTNQETRTMAMARVLFRPAARRRNILLQVQEQLLQG